MKKKYIVPQMEINKFHTEEVITASIVIGDIDDSSGYDWGDIT